jgi:hypothetical protein
MLCFSSLCFCFRVNILDEHLALVRLICCDSLQLSLVIFVCCYLIFSGVVIDICNEVSSSYYFFFSL